MQYVPEILITVTIVTWNTKQPNFVKLHKKLLIQPQNMLIYINLTNIRNVYSPSCKVQITNNHRMLIEFWLKFTNIFWPVKIHGMHPPSSLGGRRLKFLEKYFLGGASKIFILVVWWVHNPSIKSIFRITSLIYFRCTKNTHLYVLSSIPH